MAYTTDAALLQSVRDAIDAIVSGRVQSYRLGERNFTYLELSELRAMESDLGARVAKASTGGVAYASFGRPQ